MSDSARNLRYVLGLDGGGSKTACLLADDTGRVLGHGLGGPTNINFVSRRTAIASVRRAVRQAIAPIRPAEIAVACGSHTGPDWIAAMCSVVPVRQAFGVGEHEPVRAACMRQRGPGLVIVAGTGATIIAWDNRRRVVVVGGWGSPLGDEGGAYDTAMRALRAAIYGEDGRGQPTALGEAVREHFKIADLRELQRIFYQERVPRHIVSRFCCAVFAVAQAGDAAARKVLADSGRALGIAAAAAIRRRGLRRGRLDVVVSGGMVSAGRFLLAPLRREVRRAAPRTQVRPADREPVVGCLLLALGQLGRVINQDLRHRVDESMAALGLRHWPGPGGQSLVGAHGVRPGSATIPHS